VPVSSAATLQHILHPCSVNAAITRYFFVANVVFTRFFCPEYRKYALFEVEFLTEIWQKFSEILRILAEILRKKLATGASGVCEVGWKPLSRVTTLVWLVRFLSCIIYVIQTQP